ncbi:hypothetical protein ACWDTI_23225 [Gordonia sp. NPDC003424]
MRRRGSIGLAAAAGVLAGTLTGTGPAAAYPEYTSPNLVTTLRCDSASPWPNAGPIPVWVDVYNQIPFPSDGLPAPAISLDASDRSRASVITDYTIETRVTWRNLATGRTGSVTVPTRARTVTWQVDLHPGRGPVTFTIQQKIGLMAFVLMVNVKTSTCGGRATA